MRSRSTVSHRLNHCLIKEAYPYSADREMPPPKFVIEFDSPTGAYYAGTAVTGRILLTIDKPKKARGLKVKFLGQAKVSWQETESERQNDGQTRNETVMYSAEEEYFSNSYYLLGSANGDIEIPIGEHVYPFTTTLPPRLPSSFNGEHGHVKYTVTATVDRSWKSDYEAVGIFTVVTPVDLNFIAVAKEPVKKDASKTFCCWCCQSGPLSLVVCMPYTGIVPGQTFPVTIEVDNASDVNVESVDCKLKKEIEWIVRMPRYKTKEDSVDIVKVSCEGVEPTKSRTWTQSVSVPQMPHVDLEACSIINVKFLLKVSAAVGGMHKNLAVDIPLILGTVPIYDPSAGAALPMENGKENQPLLQPAVIMGQPLPGFANFDKSANVVQPAPVIGQPLPGLVQPPRIIGQPLPGMVPVGGSLPPYPVIPTGDAGFAAPAPNIGFNITPSSEPSAPTE
ncbi:Arrestin (or S-antigen), N-terminal domain [Nesidiocoris tenuis]|uniref:Arrestin (Or S-antigen), N-terminal domain n=1 Tax=Nesidiocoris tenuis TaxID=355587 RepID=A0ABN7ATU6_9HEMI|nr:Arrestin (or S-antigen), N-terminal domain [Nesidiocoris tenuis]